MAEGAGQATSQARCVDGRGWILPVNESVDCKKMIFKEEKLQDAASKLQTAGKI